MWHLLPTSKKPCTCRLHRCCADQHLLCAYMYLWHRESKPVSCRFWLFYSIIFYTASASNYFLQNQNILFLTEVIFVWFEQSIKWKNWIKSNIFRVVIILHNHYFIILKLFLVINGFILCQRKETAFLHGLQPCNLWQVHRHQLNWRIANLKTLFPICASSSISRKRQMTGFEALRHILSTFLNFSFSVLD